MRFVIVSQHFFPDQFRVNDIAFALGAQGHTVTVVTGLPDYDTGTLSAEYRLFRMRRQTLHRVEIVRVPTTLRRKGSAWRLINYVSFAASGWLYASVMRKQPIDAVISYQTSPVSQSIPAIRIARRMNCPLILYCLDVWPEVIKVWNVAESSAVYRAVSAISGRIYRAADLLPVCSRPFEQYMAEKHQVPRERLRYLPQHCEALFEQVAGRYEENGVIDFLFAGNLGSAQDIPCILRATALLRDLPGFHVHLVGSGSEMDALQALARQLGIEALVTFHGRKPLSDMPEYYRMADAFLLTLAGDSFVGQTIPGKLQSYMSAGKPIVAAINGAAIEVLDEAGCGLHAPASDAPGLADRMRRMVDEFPRLKTMGDKGREYYQQHFRQEVFLDRLLALVSEATSVRNATAAQKAKGGNPHV